MRKPNVVNRKRVGSIVDCYVCHWCKRQSTLAEFYMIFDDGEMYFACLGHAEVACKKYPTYDLADRRVHSAHFKLYPEEIKRFDADARRNH